MLNHLIESERAARDAFLGESYFRDEPVDREKGISGITDTILFAAFGTLPFVIGGAFLIAYL